MKELRIDIETFSGTDIKFGVYHYCEDPLFEILFFAYQIDDYERELIDLTNGEQIPEYVFNAIFNPKVKKKAFNAQFERVCLATYFKVYLHPESWHCTQILAVMAGLPFGLDNVAKVLNTIEQKDKIGKTLIRYFCVPCKPTKANGMRTRNLPEHDPEKWEAFGGYCLGDVATERAVGDALSWFIIPTDERRQYILDQNINDRGVRVDMDIANHAVAINDKEVAANIRLMHETYGIPNGKSPKQIKDFIFERTGITINSLNKAEIKTVQDRFYSDKVILGMLELRGKVTRTSISKYTAIQNAICGDSKLRGIIQYYGANRTGRFAGRIFQPQNLKRNQLKLLEEARELVRTNDIETLELLFEDLGDVLSNLVRTCLIPQKGGKFIISDFSAIEARVLAWLAGEQWRMDIFNSHGKIYEASASMMFGVPIESVTKGSDLRNKGKVAELALGYQGWVGALTQMGGAEMGLSEQDMRDLAGAWRKANPAIVKFWKSCENHVKHAIQVGDCRQKETGIEFRYDKRKNLAVKLPSGRSLYYVDARVDGGQISYMGLDDRKQWVRVESYGGKLCENITQAVARDLLADTMLRVDEAGFNLVLHVHDEVVCDEANTDRVDELTEILETPVSWAKGLPLTADTFEADYYQK